MTFHRKSLLQAVEMLAADADRQQAYLRGMDVPVAVDELALDFHDAWIAASFMLKGREIDTQQYEGMKELDAILDRMSGEANAALWTFDALPTAPEWAQVRNVARALLRLLEADTANFG